MNTLSFQQKFFHLVQPIKNSSCQKLEEKKVVDAFESRGQIICMRKKERRELAKDRRE